MFYHPTELYSTVLFSLVHFKSKEIFPDFYQLTALTSLPITTHKTFCSIEVRAAFHKEKPFSPGDPKGDITCVPRDSLVACAQAVPSQGMAADTGSAKAVEAAG